MRIFPIVICSCLLIHSCQSPETDNITPQDYERAVSFTWSQIKDKQAFNLFINVHWEKDYLWYEHRGPGKREFEKITYESGEHSQLFDHNRLVQLLHSRYGDSIVTDLTSLDNITIEEDDKLKISIQNESLYLDLNTLEELPPAEVQAVDPLTKLSPDGQWVAFSRGYNLWIRNTSNGHERQLTFDGKKDREYATWYGWADILEGETRDRPDNFNVRWSEDSRYLICNLVDLSLARKMYLLDWSVDSLYRPRLLGYYRGSPGDEDMVTEQPVIVHVASGRVIMPDVGRRVHINGVSFRETHDPDVLLLIYQSRGYQNQYVKKLNLNNGVLTDVYTESSQTNIDNFRIWPVKGTSKWIFASERSGWRQLYQLDIETGTYSPFTVGSYYVNEVEAIDENSQIVYFLASGKDPEMNPYLHQLYKQSLSESTATLLTPEKQHHQVNCNIEKGVFVDNQSSLNLPTVTMLRSLADGAILDTLASANTDALTQNGWEPPMAFETLARDGSTKIYGAIWQPSNFDPSKKYPVIDHSYTGPHTQVYPLDFYSAVVSSNQALAELGFIVVMIDGLGSSGRSKAFHDWSYKNLGGNLADHKIWIESLAEQYSWIDATRVGIFGHSAGGYDAAHGLLAFPDFYDVGVASSADHDHRMEKAWWPEMYMGWPVDSAYHLQSNITMAGNLKGKLLITHGGIDENVNPSATFKLAEALVKADKEFDMKIFPSQRHGYRDHVRDYFTKLRWNYFVEHLRGVEPIWEIELNPQ